MTLRRGEVLQIRLSAEEKQLWAAQAQYEKLDVSTWIRKTLAAALAVVCDEGEPLLETLAREEDAQNAPAEQPQVIEKKEVKVRRQIF